MNEQKYSKIVIKPDFKKVAIVATLVSLAVLITGVMAQVLIWQNTNFSIDFIIIFLFIAVYVAGLLLHELIHALALISISRVSFSDIHFGFNRRYLSPYTHCNKMISLGGFRIGLLLPVLITGILPLIVGIATNTLFLTLAGGLLTGGGIGDIMGFWYLVKLPGDALVRDYRYELGCEVYVRENG